MPRDTEELIEVYRTTSPIVAQKILDTLFVPENIRATVHDRLDQMLPGTGQPGGLYLAVVASDRDRAVQVLTEAHENGFLDDAEGELFQPRR
jgi:hypothetical protein